MSNIMFLNSVEAKINIAENLPLLTALLHSGSAIGNAVSLQNILMVKSVINVSEINYSKILKLNAIVVVIYLICVVIAAIILNF